MFCSISRSNLSQASLLLTVVVEKIRNLAMLVLDVMMILMRIGNQKTTINKKIKAAEQICVLDPVK